MSRGLSQQQRLILGLAVAMSRYHYGEPRAHVPQAVEGWRVPVGLTNDYPDVSPNLAAHFVHGIRIQYWKHYATMTTAGYGALQRTPEARAAINSASRAIQKLWHAGLLCYRGYRRGENMYHFAFGYLLTVAGMEIGKHYEVVLPADIGHRLIAFEWVGTEQRGPGRWGYDKSIPLVFDAPKLLAKPQLRQHQHKSVPHGEQEAAR